MKNRSRAYRCAEAKIGDILKISSKAGDEICAVLGAVVSLTPKGWLHELQLVHADGELGWEAPSRRYSPSTLAPLRNIVLIKNSGLRSRRGLARYLRRLMPMA